MSSQAKTSGHNIIIKDGGEFFGFFHFFMLFEIFILIHTLISKR